MTRRTFILSAGIAAGIAGATPPLAAAPKNRHRSAGVSLDATLLEARNRNRSTVAACHGMAATSQPLATNAALYILKEGGSAVDAALCANAMLALTEPMSCGPGGDLFAIVWDETAQKLHGLNASGRAPYAWNLDDAQKLGLKSIPAYNPLAWSVPGCVSGWKALHERFGKLPIARLLRPTIEYAREGFLLSPIIAEDFDFRADQYPTLAETYLPDGPKKFGDLFRNPQLADCLDILVRDGFDAFYRGEIAERIVRFSEANGGRFSLRDFQEHTADWVDPVSATYRDREVWELPPNGQGIAVLQILNLLEYFDIGALEPNSAAHLHLFIEAKRLAYEDRATYYADPAMAEVPVEWLISKEYAAERVKRIARDRAMEIASPGAFNDKSDTIYLTTADNDGNMVSLIQSIYHGWGSRFVPDKLGFALQNRGELFALDPNHRNRLEPHKRPFHTIIPAFVTQAGAPKFSFGVMGGDFQPQGQAQVLMNLLDFGMSPQQAGDQPRLEHDGSSTPTGNAARGVGMVHCEAGISDETRAGLEALGHKVTPIKEAFGGYQGIWREDNPRRYFGGSDPRKDGCAMGY